MVAAKLPGLELQTFQARERDYHAERAQLWIKFATECTDPRAWRAARACDDEAHHHAASAAHWQRLEEHAAAWRTHGNNSGAALRAYYDARPELRAPWQPWDGRPW